MVAYIHRWPPEMGDPDVNLRVVALDNLPVRERVRNKSKSLWKLWMKISYNWLAFPCAPSDQLNDAYSGFQTTYLQSVSPFCKEDLPMLLGWGWQSSTLPELLKN